MRWPHFIARLVSTWLICAICLPIALGAPPAASAPPMQGEVFLPSQHAGEAVQCNDAFYEYLPGLVNFCLGVHDIESGRYKNAIGWLKLAAGWGSKGAQYTLGLMYYNGDHVAADPALGLAWLRLANERHDNRQIEVETRSAMQYATPADRERANELFEAMRRRYGDKVAALRAWKQFHNYGKLVLYEMGGKGAVSSGCVFLPLGRPGWMGRPIQPQANLHSHSVGAGGCVIPAQFQAAATTLANGYFNGWSGRVTVEPLQPLPASSASSH